MIQAAITKTLDGRRLSLAEARTVMREIMDGEATPAQIGGFLVALRSRGETVEEIAGFAEGLELPGVSHAFDDAHAARGRHRGELYGVFACGGHELLKLREATEAF